MDMCMMSPRRLYEDCEVSYDVILLTGTILSLIGMFVVDPGFGMLGSAFFILPCFLLSAPMTFYFWVQWRDKA